ncbi:hypothetical protein K9M42_01710 [Patescibacteria group bacterium]|nr:hypothetical protein [Patescibacteria group bacterium]
MKKLGTLFLSSLFVFLFSFNIVLASSTEPNAYDSFMSGINSVGEDSGLSEASITEVILSVIQILIGITGTIFLIIIVYSGINWMFAAGDKGKIQKSINLMKNSAIGLAIVAFSYTIVEFIINNLMAISS